MKVESVPAWISCSEWFEQFVRLRRCINVSVRSVWFGQAALVAPGMFFVMDEFGELVPINFEVMSFSLGLNE